jgi:hypothetical protein
LVNHGDEFQVVDRVDRSTHLGAHPTACAEYAHPNGFG